jgi:signal transduction histidine kinase
VFVDAAQIGQQVLANLITNAYQAMPNGGTLTITAKVINNDADPPPASSLSPSSYSLPPTPYPLLPTPYSLLPTSVALTIADTGVGLSPEAIEKLFEPLYTTKAKGIGLGLAVSKKLIEVNDGIIEVESVEGQGSVFTITLPTAALDSG